jgi:hypothetical protein
MPLSRDPEKGGTESDGSRSTEYCSHCYRSGRFTEPDITLDQMMAKVEGKLREMHFPGFLARHFCKGIPSLRRWRAGVAA